MPLLQGIKKPQVVSTLKTTSTHRDIMATCSKTDLKEDSSFLSKNSCLIWSLVIKFSVTRIGS